jgi:hypothetical protein
MMPIDKSRLATNGCEAIRLSVKDMLYFYAAPRYQRGWSATGKWGYIGALHHARCTRLVPESPQNAFK